MLTSYINDTNLIKQTDYSFNNNYFTNNELSYAVLLAELSNNQ